MKTTKAKRVQKQKKINSHRERLLIGKPRKDKKIIQGNYDSYRLRKKLHGEKKSISQGEMAMRVMARYYK